MPRVGGDHELHAFTALRVGAVGVQRLDGVIEAAAAHAQFADQRGGLGRQLGGGSAAHTAESLGGTAPVGARLLDLAVQLRQAQVGAAQAVELGGDGLALGEQVFRGDAVLARQLVQAAELAFERVEGRRVQVEVAAHAVEHGQGFVDLDRGVVEHRIDIVQARLVLGHARQFAAHLLQAARQRRALVAAEAGEGVVAGGDQAGGMGVAAVVGLQFDDGLGFQRLAVEFGELVFQPADAVGDIALRQQRVALGQQRAPTRGGGADGGQIGGAAAVGDQQRQQAGPGQQRLGLVL
ncbi:MAG: hypothetical protein HOQ10_16375, partial [Frateuria sp.]|nr:hypothetical protein [Frateuria sp.]